MNRFFIAVSLAALPMTAVSAQAPMTPSTYVMKAGAGDQYEVQSSRIVLESTKNADLRSFANMMITDHTKSTAEVKAAAIKAGLHPASPKLDAMGMRNIAALRSAKGVTRDKLYVAQQKKAHQMALALHQNYAANGSLTPLKTVAGMIAPVVQTHIDKLAKM